MLVGGGSNFSYGIFPWGAEKCDMGQFTHGLRDPYWRAAAFHKIYFRCMTKSYLYNVGRGLIDESTRFPLYP